MLGARVSGGHKILSFLASEGESEALDVTAKYQLDCTGIQVCVGDLYEDREAITNDVHMTTLEELGPPATESLVRGRIGDSKVEVPRQEKDLNITVIDDEDQEMAGEEDDSKLWNQSFLPEDAKIKSFLNSPDGSSESQVDPNTIRHVDLVETVGDVSVWGAEGQEDARQSFVSCKLEQTSVHRRVEISTTRNKVYTVLHSPADIALFKPHGYSEAFLLITEPAQNRICTFNQGFTKFLGLFSKAGVISFEAPTDILATSNGFLVITDKNKLR